MSDRIRSEKQKINDIACSNRMKAYHAELKRLKDEVLNKVKPKKMKGKTKSVKELIENFESDSITPLKNEPDELDIPIRTKRAYNKKVKISKSTNDLNI